MGQIVPTASAPICPSSHLLRNLELGASPAARQSAPARRRLELGAWDLKIRHTRNHPKHREPTPDIQPHNHVRQCQCEATIQWARAARNLAASSPSASGKTVVLASTGMKLVSPSHRGTT